MIEISKRNGFWEAYVNGSLLHYSESLESLLNYLAGNGEDIELSLKESEVEEETAEVDQDI